MNKQSGLQISSSFGVLPSEEGIILSLTRHTFPQPITDRSYSLNAPQHSWFRHFFLLSWHCLKSYGLICSFPSDTVRPAHIQPSWFILFATTRKHTVLSYPISKFITFFIYLWTSYTFSEHSPNTPNTIVFSYFHAKIIY